MGARRVPRAGDVANYCVLLGVQNYYQLVYPATSRSPTHRLSTTCYWGSTATSCCCGRSRLQATTWVLARYLAPGLGDALGWVSFGAYLPWYYLARVLHLVAYTRQSLAFLFDA
ncbi:MAG: hypothetical protein RL012_565 [Bacteroidota bacterium]|jgi:hypothetical protein